MPGEHVLERTRCADRYMSALYGGLGVVTGLGLVVLGLTASLSAQIVAVDAIVLLLLHSRVLVAARHRLAAVIPAVLGAAALLAAGGLAAGGRHWLAALGRHGRGGGTAVHGRAVAAGTQDAPALGPVRRLAPDPRCRRAVPAHLVGAQRLPIRPLGPRLANPG